MIWLALLLPISEPTTYRVDICELNHVLRDDNVVSFDQWIWWDWGFHHTHGYDWYVRDWRVVSDVPYPLGRSQEWDDKRTKRRIRVEHAVFRETWTYCDPETRDRQRLSELERVRFGE